MRISAGIFAACLAFLISDTSFAETKVINTYGSRSFLCVKRVGRTADGSNNRGRDAFMNPSPCPRGYYTIVLSSFGVNTLGTQGDKGEKGDVGPQGAPGANGGAIVGKLVGCETEGGFANPCAASDYYEGQGGNSFHVYLPGESFNSRPNSECTFRLSNVPEGVYDLEVESQYFGNLLASVDGVAVAEGITTNLGNISVCFEKSEQPR